MEKRELRLDYQIYGNSYPMEYRDLCLKAIEATTRSYSVYSHFAVGAAVLLENGEVITGNNQENIAYPSGLCAERVALFYAGATYPDVKVKAIAIAASEGGNPVANYITPCGACRQVMAETIKRYNEDFDVIMVGGKKTVLIKASALLPFAFNLIR